MGKETVYLKFLPPRFPVLGRGWDYIAMNVGPAGFRDFLDSECEYRRLE